jgi:sRNA-binding carbon storage regulator CsrA
MNKGNRMLALSRSRNESIVIDFTDLSDEQLQHLRKRPLRIMVLDNSSHQTKLGIDAPQCIRVDRFEIWQIRHPQQQLYTH